MPPSLGEWANFYVIVGSSGAGLTGLMFVVVALAASRIRLTTSDAIGPFSTPTVAHFAMVLLVSALMAMPHRSVLGVQLCLAGCGLAGLTLTMVYGVWPMRRVTAYTPVTEDWTWHAILPVAAYLALLASALGIPSGAGALYVVATVLLLLLFIGIHNAWDTAIYIATRREDGEGDSG